MLKRGLLLLFFVLLLPFVYSLSFSEIAVREHDIILKMDNDFKDSVELFDSEHINSFGYVSLNCPNNICNGTTEYKIKISDTKITKAGSYIIQLADSEGNVFYTNTTLLNVQETNFEKCSDGTPYNECSTNKPLFCMNGQLVERCGKGTFTYYTNNLELDTTTIHTKESCGDCSTGTCQTNGSCIEEIQQTVSKQTVDEGVKLAVVGEEETKDCINNDGICPICSDPSNAVKCPKSKQCTFLNDNDCKPIVIDATFKGMEEYLDHDIGYNTRIRFSNWIDYKPIKQKVQELVEEADSLNSIHSKDFQRAILISRWVMHSKPYNYKILDDNSYTDCEHNAGNSGCTVIDAFNAIEGVCLDASMMTIAMLRLAGIPAIEDDTTSIIHARSKALIDGKWKILDSTFERQDAVIFDAPEINSFSRYYCETKDGIYSVSKYAITNEDYGTVLFPYLQETVDNKFQLRGSNDLMPVGLSSNTKFVPPSTTLNDFKIDCEDNFAYTHWYPYFLNFSAPIGKYRYTYTFTQRQPTWEIKRVAYVDLDVKKGDFIEVTSDDLVKYEDAIQEDYDELVKIIDKMYSVGLNSDNQVICIKGDLDSDEDVDVFDLLAILKVLGGASNSKADVNSDGKVDIFDLLALLNLIGKEEKCEEGKPILIGLNNKNMDLYSKKEVFLISDKNWQDVLQLVPLTTWTINADENCPQDMNELPSDYINLPDKKVCAYPTLIYHEEPSILLSKGDLNGDYKVDINDITLFVSLRNDGLYDCRADLNKNNVIDDEDLELIQSILIGKRAINEFGECSSSDSFDADSTIYFMQQYNTKKVTIIGDTPKGLDNLLVAYPELGLGLQVENIQRVRDYNYLSYWKSYDFVVYVENDYELALIASTYASLVNAPLIIQRGDLDNEENLKGRNIICVGNIERTDCSENYNLEQLQRKYVDETNTDKIILTNFNDLDYSSMDKLYSDMDDYRKSGGEVHTYFAFSLSTPILAAAKHELIITTKENEVKKVDQDLDNKLNALNLSPKYLTIIENPIIIKMDYDFCPGGIDMGGSPCKGSADNYFYANIDGDYYQELATGRIFSDTVSDVSAYISRVLFLQSIFTQNKKMVLFDNPGGDLVSYKHYIDFVDVVYGLDSKVYLGTDYTKQTFYGSLKDSTLIFTNSHGSPGGIQVVDYESKDLPWMSPLIIYTLACATCRPSVYNSPLKTPYCGKFLRKGSLAYIGAVDNYAEWSDERYPDLFFVKTFFDSLLLDGMTVGESLAYSKNMYLEGFPGNIMGPGRMLLIGDPTIKLPYVLNTDKIKIGYDKVPISDLLNNIKIDHDLPIYYEDDFKIGGYFAGKEQYHTGYHNLFETRIPLKSEEKMVSNRLFYFGDKAWTPFPEHVNKFFDYYGDYKNMFIAFEDDVEIQSVLDESANIEENDLCLKFYADNLGLGIYKNSECKDLVEIEIKDVKISIKKEFCGPNSINYLGCTDIKQEDTTYMYASTSYNIDYTIKSNIDVAIVYIGLKSYRKNIIDSSDPGIPDYMVSNNKADISSYTSSGSNNKILIDEWNNGSVTDKIKIFFYVPVKGAINYPVLGGYYEQDFNVTD